MAGLAGPAVLVEMAGQAALGDIHKEEMEEGGGILVLEEGTTLEERHTALQDIQGREVQEDHHGPSLQGEEGRMEDIVMAGQMEVRLERLLEVEVLVVELLVALVLVDLEPELVLELVPGVASRSIQNMQLAICFMKRLQTQ